MIIKNCGEWNELSKRQFIKGKENYQTINKHHTTFIIIILSYLLSLQLLLTILVFWAIQLIIDYRIDDSLIISC